ncbi:MAG: sensor histidine kinase [Christensenellaceae bacterium]|jgi:two-component system sensor histidine kinase YesM
MAKMTSFRSELFRFFSVCFIILLIILTLAIYFLLTNAMIAELSKSRIDTLTLISEKLNVLQTSMQTVSNLFYDDYLIYAGVVGEPIGSVEAYEMNVRVTTELFTTRKALKGLHDHFDIIIIAENGYHYSSSNKIRMEQVKNSEWYKNSLTSHPDDLFFVTNFNNSTRADKPEYLFLSVQHYYNFVEKQHEGTLFVCVDERAIYDCYADILSDTNSIYFVDKDGRIVSHKDASLINTVLEPEEYRSFLQSDDSYIISDNMLISKYRSPETGWFVVEESTLWSLLAPVLPMMIGIVVAVLCISAVAVILSRTIARRITRPLDEFCATMQAAGEGDLAPSRIDSRYVEIHQLSRNFNDMKDRIGTLLDDIKQQEQQMRESELRFLRAQINPHFIYNTLFSIKCTIEMNRPGDAAKMLSLFMVILQNTIHDRSETHGLQQEAEYLKDYISLLKLRYGGDLSLHTDIPPELFQYKIIKRLLQPIIENSVFHGIEPNGGNGTISITMLLEEGKLKIVIEDNGIGIPPDQLPTLLTNELHDTDAQDHIGLYNVHNRIQLHYGEEYRMEIHSIYGKGTTVTLYLPLIK